MHVIIGGGNGADLVIEYVLRGYGPCVILDDFRYGTGDAPLLKHDFPVIGPIDEQMQKMLDSDPPCIWSVFISSSNMPFRRRVFEKYKNAAAFMNVVNSDICRTVSIGRSNIIFNGVTVGEFCVIGDNNVISSGSVINHHCKIGSGNLFGPGVMLSGSVTIGDNNTFGTGIFIEPGVVIGDNCSIASGSIIVGSIPSGSRVVAKRDPSMAVYLQTVGVREPKEKE